MIQLVATPRRVDDVCMTTTAYTRFAPAEIAARRTAIYTRAEIVAVNCGVTTFWAVYTTPAGDVADRIWCYSDAPTADRVYPGYPGRPDPDRDRYDAWWTDRAGDRR